MQKNNHVGGFLFWKMDSMSRKFSSCINALYFEFLNLYIPEFKKNQLNFSNFKMFKGQNYSVSRNIFAWLWCWNILHTVLQEWTLDWTAKWVSLNNRARREMERNWWGLLGWSIKWRSSGPAWLQSKGKSHHKTRKISVSLPELLSNKFMPSISNPSKHRRPGRAPGLLNGWSSKIVHVR